MVKTNLFQLKIINFIKKLYKITKNNYEKIKGCFGLLRVTKLVTNILGPEYPRSELYVEIDITWVCNLRCYNCNRSCEQAPTNEQMSLIQILEFIKDSIMKDIKWKRIRLIGGEPTLHPKLKEIVNILHEWRIEHSPNTIIQIKSNGNGNKVKKVLKSMPDYVKINNSQKINKKQPFQAFNVAPVDQKIYKWADYRNGCWIIEKCGLGLTLYGWYHCPVAGGIDRIFGFNIGRKSIPSIDDKMYDLYKTLCPLCGHFERRFRNSVEKPELSETWEEAYLRYEKNDIVLDRIYENI